MARAILPPDITAQRAATLKAAAEKAGTRWAKSEREALHADGRRAEGGWPGTMSQARGCVRGANDNSAPDLSYEEGAWMARAIYDSARRAWLLDRDPPAGPPSDDDDDRTPLLTAGVILPLS